MRMFTPRILRLGVESGTIRILKTLKCHRVRTKHGILIMGLGAKCSVLNCPNYKLQPDRKSFYRFPIDKNL